MEKILYINSIFEGKEKDTCLLQDLLRYYLDINELPLKQSKRFKLQEILNWVVRNNKEIRDHYNNNTRRRCTPYNLRIRNFKDIIEPRFKMLLQLDLIREVGTAKAEKLNLQVPVYEYTAYGIILALLIKGLGLKKVITITKQEGKIVELEKELEKVYQYIYEMLAGKINKSSAATTIFYSILFRRLKEKGNFSKLVESMYDIINMSNNVVSVNDLVTRAIYTTFFDEQSEKVMFYETYEELDQDSKKLVLYNTKMSLENRFEDTQEELSRNNNIWP